MFEDIGDLIVGRRLSFIVMPCPTRYSMYDELARGIYRQVPTLGEEINERGSCNANPLLQIHACETIAETFEDIADVFREVAHARLAAVAGQEDPTEATQSLMKGLRSPRNDSDVESTSCL